MNSPRVAAVAALSSMILVSACSDSEPQTTSDEGSTTASVDSDAATDPSDDVASTAGPDDDAESTEQAQSAGVMSVEEAEAVATQLLTSAEAVLEKDGDAIKDELEATYRGPALEAAIAADLLEPVTGNPESRDLIADPIEPNVLAISRDDGQEPNVLLVQTVPDTGNPILYLMTSPSGTDKFRITWSAPMLPGTDIGTFDRRSLGSPIVRDDTQASDLSQTPRTVLEEFAAYINYPVEARPEMRTNDYAPQVRRAAAAQIEEVERQADFTETNSLSDTRIRTLLREDGSAITFALLDRESTFDIKSGMELTPPKPFLVFADDDSLTDSATLDTHVFVAVMIPKGSGPPEMIAAREQIVGASGS
ncbi:MAG: hypothetical protein WA880_08720 [Ornithinimicrobium sp.]